MPDGSDRAATLLPAANGHDRLRSEYSTPLSVLMWMVGLVLLVSCVNVANLLLVRGTARAPTKSRYVCRLAEAVGVSSGNS